MKGSHRNCFRSQQQNGGGKRWDLRDERQVRRRFVRCKQSDLQLLLFFFLFLYLAFFLIRGWDWQHQQQQLEYVNNGHRVERRQHESGGAQITQPLRVSSVRVCMSVCLTGPSCNRPERTTKERKKKWQYFLFPGKSETFRVGLSSACVHKERACCLSDARGTFGKSDFCGKNRSYKQICTCVCTYCT